MTPILRLPQVATNQSQKETTINTAIAKLEGAGNDHVSVDLSNGAVTLDPDVFTSYFMFEVTGQTATVILSVPATPRVFAVRNTGSISMSVRLVGQSTGAITVAAGGFALIVSNGALLRTSSGGASALDDLQDVDASSPSDGQVLGFNGSTNQWEPYDVPADAEVRIDGKPTAGQVVYRRMFARGARFYSDFAQSQFKLDTAPTTETAVFNVMKNATVVGTITFAPNATTPTYSTDTGGGSTLVNFASGDVMSIVAPGTQDATLAGLIGALKGVYR